MVKIKGPLFSVGAHGSLEKVLTYSKRKSGDQTRKYNKPTVPASAAQRGQRRLTEFLVAQWQNMTPAQRATWETNAKASDKNLPGYHYFLHEAQRDLYTHHGLCGYWSFNEIINGKVNDISGNANHGSLSPDYPSNAPTLITSPIAKYSNALNFDGNDDFVSVAHAPSLNAPNAITIEALLRGTTLGSSEHFFGKGFKIFYRQSVSRIEIGLDIGVIKYAKSTNIYLYIDKTSIVTATYDKDDGTNKIRIYHNGKEVNYSVQDDTSGGAIELDSSSVLLGKRTDGFPYTGIIDEVCFYNRGFSAAEIATRYDFATRKV